MRRWITLVIVAAVAVTAFAPAQATDDGSPMHILCSGTAGYEGSVWKAEGSVNTPFLGLTACWFPSGHIYPPSDPPAFNPFKLDDYLWWLLSYSLGPKAPVTNTQMALTGAGDFACGDGSLSTTAGDNNFWYWGSDGLDHLWPLDWTATFSNGVGELTGTATHYTRQPLTTTFVPTGEVRTLSGTIVVADGGQTPLCDDSAGASQFLAVLTLS